MSDQEINLNDPDHEMIFYLSNKIGKGKDLNTTSSKVYAQAIISKIRNEYQVGDNKLIGVCGTIESMEYLLITFLDGYMNYRITNDIDFEHPLPDNV